MVCPGLYNSGRDSLYWYIFRKTAKLASCYGFAKWGMTSSMISAEAITNQILNRPNEMMEIFSPGREVSTSAILSMMKDGAHTVMDFSQYIIPDTGKKTCTHMGCPLSMEPEERLMNVRAMFPVCKDGKLRMALHKKIWPVGLPDQTKELK